MNSSFFPERPDVDPRIYVYSMPENAGELRKGELKVGYTTRTAVERINEQSGAMRINPKILLDIPAVKYDGTYFKDHDVHRVLRGKGAINTDGEWFKTSLNDVKAAILAVQSGDQNVENRTQDFKMRPEQLEAVEQTAHYFSDERRDNSDKTPHLSLIHI